MSKPSKEAWALAHGLDKPVCLLGQDLTWLAVALQELMDEREQGFAALEEAKHYEFERAEAAEADAALAWRRVTELQERASQALVEHRHALLALRHERDFADAAAAGYEETSRYWERRLRSLVRRVEDLASAGGADAAKLEAVAREFYDHDWDGEPEAGAAS